MRGITMLKKYITLAIAALALHALPTYAQSYQQLVIEATQALEAGKTADAIENYAKAIALDPDNRANEYIYANLAAAYIQGKNSKEAESTYNTALNKFPESKRLLQLRGNFYLDAGYLEKAQKDYDKILTNEPYNQEVLYHRAYIHAKNKEKENAYKDYYAILTANPDNHKARFALALLYSNDNKREEAQLQLDHLIETNPDNADYYTAASNIAEKQKKIELALTYIDEGITKCRDNTTLFIRKAELLIAAKQKKEAKAILDKLALDGKYSPQMNILYKKCK